MKCEVDGGGVGVVWSVKCEVDGGGVGVVWSGRGEDAQGPTQLHLQTANQVVYYVKGVQDLANDHRLPSTAMILQSQELGSVCLKRTLVPGTLQGAVWRFGRARHGHSTLQCLCGALCSGPHLVGAIVEAACPPLGMVPRLPLPEVVPVGAVKQVEPVYGVGGG
eukprot:9246200-Pyramimonas_sp.AAC.1